MTEGQFVEWLMQDDRILKADNVPRFLGVRDGLRYMQDSERVPGQNVISCKMHSDLVDESAWVGMFYDECLLDDVDDLAGAEALKRFLFNTFEFMERERQAEK